MKKTYSNPTLKVVMIATHQMLAASPTSLGFSGTGATKDTNGDYNDARGGWFDESEE